MLSLGREVQEEEDNRRTAAGQGYDYGGTGERKYGKIHYVSETIEQVSLTLLPRSEGSHLRYWEIQYVSGTTE